VRGRVSVSVTFTVRVRVGVRVLQKRILILNLRPFRSGKCDEAVTVEGYD